jgi:hypothetical protein
MRGESKRIGQNGRANEMTGSIPMPSKGAVLREAGLKMSDFYAVLGIPITRSVASVTTLETIRSHRKGWASYLGGVSLWIVVLF